MIFQGYMYNVRMLMALLLISQVTISFINNTALVGAALYLQYMEHCSFDVSNSQELSIPWNKLFRSNMIFKYRYVFASSYLSITTRFLLCWNYSVVVACFNLTCVQWQWEHWTFTWCKKKHFLYTCGTDWHIQQNSELEYWWNGIQPW